MTVSEALPAVELVRRLGPDGIVRWSQKIGQGAKVYSTG